MRNFIFILLLVISCCSCSQKVYFFEAQKLPTQTSKNEDVVVVDAFFAGDALDYVVFELDIYNNSMDTLNLDYRKIYLEAIEENEASISTLYALNSNDVIFEVEERSRQLKAEKTGRDIGNAISIGLNLLLIGSGNYNAIDAVVYSTETAAYMLEDARSHKLIKGSLEEQIQYLDEWVLYKEQLGPNEENTWDVLFDRQLFNAEADFVIVINDQSYKIPFDIFIKEEKVH